MPNIYQDSLIMHPTTALFIDDNLSIRRMFEKFLTHAGFRVVLAADGEEGLQAFHLHKPDIVLVDLLMPKVDGFEVLTVLREESPETPVIVLSGKGGMKDVIRALRLGAWNFHTKPIENITLIKYAIDQALEKAKLLRENRAYQKGLETKLSSLVENLIGFVLTCDVQCRVTYANQALQRYFGRDIMGEFFYKIFLGANASCPWCHEDPSRTEESIQQEIHNPLDDCWYHTIHSLVYDPLGNVIERQILLYDITESKRLETELKEKEEYLRKENMRLRGSLSDRYKFHGIIGISKSMQGVYESIINAAASDASIVIYGESGTGKELVAKAIHENSGRSQKPLVYVNCGAIPENLIESEFFGYKKGAFTGANRDKHGYLEIADDSTLFLDEIGEIPLTMQVKLLRAIEGNGYTPVGSTDLHIPNIRIIAATNKNLQEEVHAGRMRQDFLYRIHIIAISLPPLRDRREDIPLLTDHFLEKNDSDSIPRLSAQILQALKEYNWPGNVRELQNTLQRFVTLKKLDFMGEHFTNQADMDETGLREDRQDKPLSDLLKQYEKKILLHYFKMNNFHHSETAKALQVDRKTLYRKMKQHGIGKLPLS